MNEIRRVYIAHTLKGLSLNVPAKLIDAPGPGKATLIIGYGSDEKGGYIEYQIVDL